MALILLFSWDLAGEDPVTFDVNLISEKIFQIKSEKKIFLNGTHPHRF